MLWHDSHLYGFRLYNSQYDVVNRRAEVSVPAEYPLYKLQEPCSWGSVVAGPAHARFLRWYAARMAAFPRWDPPLPASWTNTWLTANSPKKYLQRFLVEEALYMLAINAPARLSFTTNHNSPGTNVKSQAWWFDALSERVALPLVTPALVASYAAQGIDLLATPPLATLPLFDWRRQPATPDSLAAAAAAMASDPAFAPGHDAALASAVALEPPIARGVRASMVARATSDLGAELIRAGTLQRHHADLTPLEGEALRTLLVREEGA